MPPALTIDAADTDDDDDGGGGSTNSGTMERRQEYGSRMTHWPQRRHLEPAWTHRHHNRLHVIGDRSADSYIDGGQHCGSNSSTKTSDPHIDGTHGSSGYTGD